MYYGWDFMNGDIFIKIYIFLNPETSTRIDPASAPGWSGLTTTATRDTPLLNE